MTHALRGASTLLLLSARESANRIEQHRAAVDAAVEAGVERIVYVSFVGASPGAVFTLVRPPRATGKYIRASGPRRTPPPVNLYIYFLPSFVSSLGRIRGPARVR